jgi:hypothetical protein
MIRDVPPVGAYFFSYYSLQKLLGVDPNRSFKDIDRLTILKKMVAGGFAG